MVREERAAKAASVPTIAAVNALSLVVLGRADQFLGGEEETCCGVGKAETGNLSESHLEGGMGATTGTVLYFEEAAIGPWIEIGVESILATVDSVGTARV